MKKTVIAFVFACIYATFAQNAAQLERVSVELERNGNTWKLERNYDFINGRETVQKELDISSFKTHPDYAHINGYNNDVVIRISLPYVIENLKTNGEIANYTDSTERKYQLSYSLDGLNYTVLDTQAHGAGQCSLSGEAAEISQNKGLVYLKYERVLAADDSNGRHGYVLWSQIGFSINCKNEQAFSEKATESKHLKNVFPTGVFWPWERTGYCANNAKMELWDFVDKTMGLLKDNGYDTIWFVNMTTGDMMKTLQYAEKHNLKVLHNTDLLHVVYNGTHSISYMENLAWSSFKYLGGSDALLGYVVKDEPQRWETEHMSTFADIMKAVDPSRDTIGVCMNRESLTYLRDSSMPVICSDIYYFGAENTTQLPTPEKSKEEVTNALANIGIAAEKYNKHSWFMAQMYAETWGRNWRRGDKLVVEPGTYLHWKMPTDAEARWQLWEGLRQGTKGLFFFVLFPQQQLTVPPAEVKTDSEINAVKNMDSLAAWAASWEKQKLTETEIEIDAGEAMTDTDGTPRPQMLATAPVMKLIRKNEQLLVKRHFARMPIFYSGDANTDTMTFDSEGRFIGVIVNNDLLASHDAKVLLPPNVKQVIDLGTGNTLELTEESDIFKSVTIPLAAGNGALLEAKFLARPGICLLKEDFNRQTFLRLNIGNNAKVERYGSYGLDGRFAVSLNDDAADHSEPVCVIPNLTNSKQNNTISYQLNRTSKQGIIYCQVKGKLTSCKVRAVAEDIDSAMENFKHLKETASYDIGKSDNGVVIQDHDFFKPAEIPVGTSALEFYLDSPDDMISEIELWFVPNN